MNPLDLVRPDLAGFVPYASARRMGAPVAVRLDANEAPWSPCGDTLDLNRYPHDVLLDRIWELRHNASAYDAAYLSLAEVLEAPLLTTDARLARVADTRAVIEVL